MTNSSARSHGQTDHPSHVRSCRRRCQAADAVATPANVVRVATHRRASTNETNQKWTMEAQAQRLKAQVAWQEDRVIVADCEERGKRQEHRRPAPVP